MIPNGKFRGKRVDNGNWVFGYYFKTPLTDEATTDSMPEDGWFFLSGRPRHCISNIDNGLVYEVIPESVSQWTTQYDCTSWQEITENERDAWTIAGGNMPSEWKGIEIYQNDILEVIINGIDKIRGVIKFDFSAFVFSYINKATGIEMQQPIDTLPPYKVIGNTTDNPELIEVHKQCK